MVSLDGNLYSVPDGTARRSVEVRVLAREIRILEAGRLIAVHPVLSGRGGRSLLPGHRRRPGNADPARDDDRLVRPGELIRQRPLQIYDQVAQALAGRPA